MKTANLKARILIPMALALALALGALIAGLFIEQDEHTEKELTRTVQSLQENYKAILEERAQKLIAILDSITDDAGLRKTLKTANRESMLAYTNPLFQRLKSKYKITHFYIHNPQRVNLLRVHQPERYGDTINRFTMLAAERSGNTSYGVELGPLGIFTLRAVSPIWDQGSILGYIELGEEVDSLISNIAPILDVELIIAIDKDFIKRADWETGMRMLARETNWDQYPDSVIALQTHQLPADIISTLMKQGAKSRSAESGGIEVVWQDRRYRLASAELLDAGNRVVGELLVLRDMTARINSSHTTLLLIAAGALLLSVVLISFFYFVLDQAENALITCWQSWQEDGDKKKPHISIHKILIFLMVSIFTAELAVMLILPENFSMMQAALIDAGILIIVLFPMLYLIITSANVQQRKQYLQIEHVAQRMGRILDQSANEIYIFNADDMHFVEVSEGARKHLGYNMNELKQLTPVDLKPEFTYGEFEDLIEPQLQGKEQQLTFETVHECKDGTRYPVEVSLQLSSEETPPVFIAIINDISERNKYIAELEHKALYDSLTELPNRFLLHDRLQHALKAAKRDSLHLAIIIIDIARLNDINATFGHSGGDLVLQEIANRLRKSLRKSDTVARLDSAEFALVMPAALFEHIHITIDKIHSLFEQTITVDDVALEIEAVFGIAMYPDHGDTADILLQRANIALRAAKKETFEFSVYDLENDPSSLRRLKLFGELRQAIMKKELFLHYQPQIDIRTSKIISVEALARWHHPVEGMIPPNDFIPMIEQSGLIKPFTLWVLDEAIGQLKRWSQQGVNLTIAVNLSARNLLDPRLPDAIAAMLEIHNVDPTRLTLEVTESAIMTRPEKALKILTRLHDMGFKLSIDDFGTGYSSLAYLKKFPVDELKIDQSFVFDLAKNNEDIIIVRSTIDLAQNMGLKVVAEGVEDEHVLAKLSTLSCNLAQGYHMSRPLPIQDLENWLLDSPWGLRND